MQSPKTPTRTAEDERRDVLNYIRRRGNEWSCAPIRPGRDSALADIESAIEQGHHVGTAPAHIATPNPDSYRSIALSAGAKECNVYLHDDKVVVVVEMGLNRRLSDVWNALRNAGSGSRDLVVREVRSPTGGTADVQESTKPDPVKVITDKPTLSDLERRFAELESSVRNNTRRLDMAAAACRATVDHCLNGAGVASFAERLGTGLKEQA